ncbi:MAG: hypothetical protein K0U98_06005 [Deltaproteobacteria bacterium]|nr:hypothetical protein [Deltaproteobacteria bacterium]
MDLLISDSKTEVLGLCSMLTLNASFRVTCRLRSTDPENLRRALAAAERAELASDARSWSGRVRGWRFEGDKIEVEVEGLSDRQDVWLRSAVAKKIISQRPESEDACTFLNGVFDQHCESPERTKPFELALPAGVCLLRHEFATQALFLRQVAAFLRERSPDVLGFLVADREAEGETRRQDWIRWIVRPERRDEPVLELPARQTPALALPDLFEVSSWDGSCEVNTPLAKAVDPLELIACWGQADSTCPVEGAPCWLPGPARCGRHEVVVDSVSHRIDLLGEDVGKTLTTVATIGGRTQPAPETVVPWVVVGTVRGWLSDSSNWGTLAGEETSLIEVASGEGDAWQIGMTGKAEKCLVAHPLVPTPVRESHVGLYSAWRSGDRVAVRVAPGTRPAVMGAFQHRVESLEEVAVALQAESIALDVSGGGTALSEVVGLHLPDTDKAVWRSRQETELCSESIALRGTGDIEIEGKTAIKGDTDVDGKTRLKGDVEMGNPG